MAEEKEKKTKTTSATRSTKTISIKNKKVAKQTLAKASIKGKKTTTKTTTKSSTVKKKPKTSINNEVVIEEKNLLINDKEIKPEKKDTKTLKEKKTRIVKAPNNIKRKLKNDKKKEEPKHNIDEKELVGIDELLINEKTTIPNNIIKVEKEEKDDTSKELVSLKEQKKLDRIKIREEKRKKKKEKKQKEKEEKNRLKEKKRKDKQKLKELKKKKSKIEFPKEWKTINTKNNKVIKSKEEIPKTFKGKIRSSIFESIDERELEERKKKSKESIKKTFIILLIIGIIITVTVYSLIKYNDYVRKKLAVYESFRIGDSVILNDNTTWRVIVDSDSSEDTIKLLANHVVDVDNNGVIDSGDVVPYNSTGKAQYDSSIENSVANLLSDSYKKRYEPGVGEIEEMSILTSKEYVKIRERMNYGDEWNQDNWLAGVYIQQWWILSEQNDKVFVVTSRGTFILTSPTKSYYIRPTIVIKKDLVTKIDDTKEITIDLINGLKRKQG